jgi:hypothetical protein
MTGGYILATQNDQLESTFGDVRHCDYRDRQCTLADESVIIWEKIDEK